MNSSIKISSKVCLRLKKKKQNKLEKQPAGFLQKIYDIVSNTEHTDIISFLVEGNAFEVKDPQIFSQKILPLFFKHGNFSSFIRQLNLYGFKKIRNVNNHYEFRHKYFRRDQKNLLQKIIRKNNQKLQTNLKKIQRNFELQQVYSKFQNLTLELKSTNKDVIELEDSCLKCLKGQQLVQQSMNLLKQEIFRYQQQRSIFNSFFQFAVQSATQNLLYLQQNIQNDNNPIQSSSTIENGPKHQSLKSNPQNSNQETIKEQQYIGIEQKFMQSNNYNKLQEIKQLYFNQ